MMSVQSRIKENLFLGLITLAPLVVTFWILSSIVNFLDEVMYEWIPSLRIAKEAFFGFGIPGLGILITFLLLLGFGALAKTVAGDMLNRLSDAAISRVPIIRGLYGVTKQISSVFFSQSPSSAFKKVVYIPFPHAGSKTLAFVASQTENGETFVFVPTAPNPTSGYVLRFKDEELEESNMTVDAALQLIISCGALGVANGTKIEEV